MGFRLTQEDRDELIFARFDSTRDVIEVNGVLQDTSKFFRMGLWAVLVEVAIRTKHMPCTGHEPEFERLVAHLKEFEVNRNGERTIYRLTF